MENKQEAKYLELKKLIRTQADLEIFFELGPHNTEVITRRIKELHIDSDLATEMFNFDHTDTFNPFISALTYYHKSIPNLNFNIGYFKTIALNEEIITSYLGIIKIGEAEGCEKVVQKYLKKFDSALKSAIEESKRGNYTKITRINKMLRNVDKFRAKYSDYYDSIESRIGNLALMKVFCEIANVNEYDLELMRYLELKGSNDEVGIDQVKIDEFDLHKKIVIDKLVELIINANDDYTCEINELVLYFSLDEMNEMNNRPSMIKNNTVVAPKLEEVKLDYSQLEKKLKTAIIGQNEAIETIIRRMKITDFGVSKECGAKAVYLLVGPTGVGKTEITKLIAGENIVRIDMSEFKESHTISRLLGAPAGYVGYEEKEDNSIFAKIAKKPNAIILLDEIEKAHPDILDLFLHVFDEGKGTTSRQQVIDFSNNQIFLTSNIGTFEASKATLGFGSENFSKTTTYKEQLEKTLRPEFLNRIDEIIYFKNLTKENVIEIINNKIESISKKISSTKGIELNIDYTSEFMNFLVASTDYYKYGAREINRLIEKTLIISIANYFSENGYKNVNLELSFDGEIQYQYSEYY